MLGGRGWPLSFLPLCASAPVPHRALKTPGVSEQQPFLPPIQAQVITVWVSNPALLTWGSLLVMLFPSVENGFDFSEDYRSSKSSST